MLRKTNNIFLVFHLLITLFISFLLLFSTRFQGFQQWIDKITGENSVLEIGIFFLLLMISTFAMLISFNNQNEKAFTRARRHFIAIIAICFYLIAMQEVRWGKLLLRSNDTSDSDSLMGIVGLHGIVTVEQVNTTIYVMILFGFILFPLLIYYRPALFGKNPSVRGKTIIYLPSIHCMLMFCFACSLQTLINPLTRFDHFVLLFVFLAIFGLMFYKNKLRSVANMAHWFLVAGSWVLYRIYSEKIPVSSDYHHLWKLVAVYTFFYWLYNWAMTLKEKAEVSFHRLK